MKGTDLPELYAAKSSALLPSGSLALRVSLRRLGAGPALRIALVLLVGVALSRAVTPDPKLVSLIPPTAQIVAGMNVPPRSGQPSTLLLVTHNNHVDLNDLIALIGVDPSRAIDQIIMAASDEGGHAYTQHSLVASGHFDQRLIYNAAHAAGAKPIDYRGIHVLEMQPLARERDSFHDVRWLAIIDSKLALFGTIALVQQELDRYLARTPADPSLARKVAHLRRDDATWCVAIMPEHNNEIHAILASLDARFMDLRAGDTLQLGIHFGRDVEFEYEVAKPPSYAVPAIETFAGQSPSETEPSTVFTATQLTRINSSTTGILKVPKARYEAWIAESLSTVHLRTGSAPPR